MALEKIEIENFTAFDHLELTFSSGLNVLIGENGTGKTHLMKLGYSWYDYKKNHNQDNWINEGTLPSSLLSLFMPYNKVSKGIDSLKRLIRKPKNKAVFTSYFSSKKVCIFIQKHNTDGAMIGGDTFTASNLKTSIYIPPKDMLANAPGFRSLYEKREIHFESIYKDILDSAFLPFLRESNLTKAQNNMLAMLEKHIGGKVSVRGETFFLDNGTDEPLEFDLLAEGLRKLGLLWLLIRNGELDKDTVLFWDEPEANLNPKLMGVIVQVLIELQRMGVQIILATHNFVLLQELDLRLEVQDEISFHSLYKDAETQEIKVESAPHFRKLTHNAIATTYTELYDRDIEKSIESLTADTTKDAAE